MNEPLKMILIFIAGLVLGTVFFGGLWLTVKKTATSTSPALLVLGSFVFRMVLVLLGFYAIGAGSWQRLLLMLSGVIIARLLVTYFTKTSIAKKEVRHET